MRENLKSQSVCMTPSMCSDKMGQHKTQGEWGEVHWCPWCSLNVSYVTNGHRLYYERFKSMPMYGIVQLILNLIKQVLE